MKKEIFLIKICAVALVSAIALSCSGDDGNNDSSSSSGISSLTDENSSSSLNTYEDSSSSEEEISSSSENYSSSSSETNENPSSSSEVNSLESSSSSSSDGNSSESSSSSSSEGNSSESSSSSSSEDNSSESSSSSSSDGNFSESSSSSSSEDNSSESGSSSSSEGNSSESKSSSSSEINVSSSSSNISSNCLDDYDPTKQFCDNRDGKIYKFIEIGTQIWMAENLNYDENESSKCYNDDTEYCDKYGRLYNWVRAMAACPENWHLPKNTEWAKLFDYIDGPSGTSDDSFDSYTAGKYLKTTNGWNDNEGASGNGTDDYGFAALPGGGYSNGSFHDLGNYGYFWTATEGSATSAQNQAYMKVIRYNNDGVGRNNSQKAYFRSVRCLKD